MRSLWLWDKIMAERLAQNHFALLPIPVQTKIFLFLRPTKRQQIRVVCLQWKEILDEILISIDINNENYEITTQQKDETSVRILNLTAEFSGVVAFKDTIRRLEFYGITVASNLLHFLQECNLVQELNFGNVTLETLTKIICPKGLTLPNVKIMNFHLKFHHVTLTAHEVILFDFLHQIQFGKLEQVQVGRARDQNNIYFIDGNHKVHLTNSPSDLQSSALLRFLIANCRTLKKFSATCFRLFVFGFTTKAFGDSLDKLQFEDLTWIIIKPSNFCGNEAIVISSQRNLKKLNVRTRNLFWPSVVRCIQGSSGSLTDVKISFDYHGQVGAEAISKVTVSDASIFKECSKLETLCWNIWNTKERISNLTSLPVSIQILDLAAVMTRDDLLTIASTLCNLKVFDCSVSFCDQTKFAEIDPDLLRAFIRINTLENMTVNPCRNDEAKLSNFAESQNEFEILFRKMNFSESWQFKMSKLIKPARKYCTIV